VGPPPCIYWKAAAAHEAALLADFQAAAPERARCPMGSSLVLGRGFVLCARNEFSLVDQQVRETGRWADCDVLIDLAHAIGGRLRVLDAGAHIGTCALLLAAAGHMVAAFEPHNGSFAQLSASVRLNRLSEAQACGRGLVEVHHLALAEQFGRRLIWEKIRNQAASVAVPEGLEPDELLARSGHTDSRVPEEVRATLYGNASWAEAAPLDEVRVFGSRPPRAFDLAKLDVNGGELGLVRGAVMTFLTPPLIVKFEFWPDLIRLLDGNPLQLLQYFHAKGYDLWVLRGTNGGLETTFRVHDDGQSVLDGIGVAFDRFTDVVAVNKVRWPARRSLRETLAV